MALLSVTFVGHFIQIVLFQVDCGEFGSEFFLKSYMVKTISYYGFLVLHLSAPIIFFKVSHVGSFMISLGASRLAKSILLGTLFYNELAARF